MALLMNRIFWNFSEDRLRAPARLILQLAFTVTAAFLGIIGVGSLLTYGRHHGLLAGLNKQTFDHIGNILISPVAATLMYLTMRVGARRIEGRDFSIYGVALSRGWMRECALGFTLAAVLMTLVFAVELMAGWIHVVAFVAVTNADNVLAISLLYSLVKVVTVGVLEELVFRGLILRILLEGLAGFAGMGVKSSRAAALLSSSLLFGVIHLTNPNCERGRASDRARAIQPRHHPPWPAAAGVTAPPPRRAPRAMPPAAVPPA